ncbi:hypothetical protein [Noviherbaspirillum galbum]|uniref:Uncharacterized protein n=1 Tax=Noviherbaspirillum galbum TaxID=2709383 RepID=A0A6B3SRI3_9BURK|nr:hypothetical protein [Noviherbaspirillum galbum]NEX61032.1 hypothetical protein [Noviherbaspirillum galbum]
MPTSLRQMLPLPMLPADRQNRRLAGFLLVSVLLHALLLLVVRQPALLDFPAGEPNDAPISVRIERAPPPPRSAPVAPAEPRPAPKEKQEKPKPPVKRPPQARIKPLPKPSPVPAAPDVTPQPVPQPLPSEPPEQARTPPAADMSEMIAAARARREAQRAAETGNSEQAPTEPGKNDIALANINRDLQRASRKPVLTSGVFQIVNKGVRTAQVQFRGWDPASDATWRQTLDVDAGLNGDIDHAIVRRIIALIRTHHNADFNWQSHRLGRVIVLSARPQDNAALESFLMQEFFGG